MALEQRGDLAAPQGEAPDDQRSVRASIDVDYEAAERAEVGPRWVVADRHAQLDRREQCSHDLVRADRALVNIDANRLC